MKTVESEDEIEDSKEIESKTGNVTNEQDLNFQLHAKYLMQRNREMREIQVEFR